MRKATACLLATGLICALGSPAQAGYVDTIIAANPVVYYTFDYATDPGAGGVNNEGTAGDSYDGSSAGTVGFGAAAVSAELGYAFDLSGTNNGQLGTGANISTYLNVTSSLEFWIKTTRNGPVPPTWQSPALTGQDQTGGLDDIWWGVNSGGKVGIMIGDNSETPLTPIAINDGAWHYLLITRDKPTGVMNIYLDGNPTAVTTLDKADNRNLGKDYNWLGHGQDGNSNAILDAVIDDVAIYSTVLTGADAQTHYQASIPEPATLGLLALGGLAMIRRKRGRN